jgi:hypothetical protein
MAADVAEACQVSGPTQLLVEGVLMKVLARSSDGTLMCCVSETLLKLVDPSLLNLYETKTRGAVTAASFHPVEYKLFLKIDNRIMVSRRVEGLGPRD